MGVELLLLGTRPGLLALHSVDLLCIVATLPSEFAAGDLLPHPCIDLGGRSCDLAWTPLLVVLPQAQEEPSRLVVRIHLFAAPCLKEVSLHP